MTVQERLDVLDAADLIHWPKKGTMPAYRRYLSAALRAPIQEIVWDIAPIGSVANERMGYATQKPVALLERIIDASSNEGDMVLDPFCGRATTIEAAHRLGRRWIGIDIAIHAIKRVAQIRLSERLHLKAGEIYTWWKASRAIWKAHKTSGNVTNTTSKSGQSSKLMTL